MEERTVSLRATATLAVEPNTITLPPDYPQRFLLADEIHARPSEALSTPSRASHIAVLVEPVRRQEEYAHLVALCSIFGVSGPPDGATFFTVTLGEVRLKWEAHGEFSGYTFFTAGRSPLPFSEPPVLQLPQGWLTTIPGEVIFAAHAKIVPLEGELPSSEFLSRHFADHIVVGAEVGEGAGLVFSDFRRDSNGFGRFLILDRQLTARQAGRMLQRLLEIETYRMLALMALPLAREYAPLVVAIERALSSLTAEIAAETTRDESLLHELTRLAAEIERSLAATQFRFGACRAYGELVTRRIRELREKRLAGLQTIEEFMGRRFSPAVATCLSTSERLQKLAARIGQASALLSTRVDIVRERQNQQLLKSMNLRAERQLRLQQAVEWLSVAAISYYFTALVGYGAKALKAGGWHIDPDIAVGAAIPLVMVAVAWAVWRAHISTSQSASATAGTEPNDV